MMCMQHWGWVVWLTLCCHQMWLRMYLFFNKVSLKPICYFKTVFNSLPAVMSDSNVNRNLSCVGAKKSVQSSSRCCVVKKQMPSKVPWRKPLLSWRLTVSFARQILCVSQWLIAERLSVRHIIVQARRALEGSLSEVVLVCLSVTMGQGLSYRETLGLKHIEQHWI